MNCIYEIIYVQSVCFVILLVYIDVTSPPIDDTNTGDESEDYDEYEDEW